MFRLNINGQTHEVGDDVDPQTPLLWVLRDTLGLVGTKYGCGVGQCSACTVQLNGSPIQSCQVPAPPASSDQKITTIEGLATPGRAADGRAASVDRGGRSRSAATAKRARSCARRRCSRALRSRRTTRSTRDMAANICRCGTYTRIRKAIHSAADEDREDRRCVDEHERAFTPNPTCRSSCRSCTRSASTKRRRFSRRSFIKLTGLAGGGLVLALSLAHGAQGARASRAAAQRSRRIRTCRSSRTARSCCSRRIPKSARA